MRSGSERQGRRASVGRDLLTRFLLGNALISGLVLSSGSVAIADSTYQCMPSGFTIGIPRFHVSHDAQARYESIRLHLEPLQNELAEILSKSGLFSNVVVLREIPRPDSTDLTLLVSISGFREVEGSGGPNFEISLSVLLTENLGGRALFQQSYFRQIRGRYSPAAPQGVGPSLDLEVAFPEIAVSIARDLNSTLNQSSDPSLSTLKASRSVSHSSLAEMRIMHPIVENAGAGVGNYSRYIDEDLRERLERKDCFLITDLSENMARCLQDSIRAGSDQEFLRLGRCLTDSTWHGFLLVDWVWRVSDSLRVRSVLLMVPEMDVLYDKSLTTVTGWRLGNTLEQHAAGIAQASHANPH